MQNLFYYPIVVDNLSTLEKKFNITANEEELGFIAEVLKVKSCKEISAEIFVNLNKKEHFLSVQGKIKANLELQSVISLEYFFKTYTPEFELLFDTHLTLKEFKEREELGEENIPDIITNGQVDLGQIIIEQIALIMDDYPRKDGESFNFASEFDEETTKEQNPFNVLAKLKK